MKKKKIEEDLNVFLEQFKGQEVTKELCRNIEVGVKMFLQHKGADAYNLDIKAAPDNAGSITVKINHKDEEGTDETGSN